MKNPYLPGLEPGSRHDEPTSAAGMYAEALSVELQMGNDARI